MSAGSTQFDKIYYEGHVGQIRVAHSGMAWKGTDVPMVTMPGTEIKWAQWLRVARGFQLRLGMANHRREKLDGFDREDHEKLQTLLKNYFSVTLETKEVSFKGWNWGHADFQGQELAFLVSDRTAFELPLERVSNSNIAGRTEVSLEFSNEAAKGSKNTEDEMVEIRFHVPGTQTKLKSGSDAGDADEPEEEEISAAQVFHDQIKEKADIGQVTGDMILSFEEVLVVTPRGRYDLDMFSEFLRLRGKTYDYKIVFSTISRLFLLPKDDQTVLFILALNAPIRQGQTRYHYLVLSFGTDEEITAELNLTPEQEEEYKLDKTYDVPTYELISTIFRALVGKKIIKPGSYKSRDDRPNVKAHMKAVLGELFLLEKSLFFVAKAPTLIPIVDIHTVSFSRVGSGASQRTFDLTVTTKEGPEYVFSTIAKDEQENLEKFLEEKNVRVKIAPTEEQELEALALSDGDDDDMGSISSAGSDAPRPKKGGGADDDSSEEDEDFQASSSDAGSPSESDGASDGAATASDASGDRDFAKKKKKKVKGAEKTNEDGTPKKKKKVKKVPAKTSASGDEMDVDGEDKPKPKPKPKKKKADAAEPMDVDAPEGSHPVKPKPKPKPKKAAEDPDEPPKKKAKKAAD